MKQAIRKTLLVVICILFLSVNRALAIENPLSMPNNKVGVHILFPQEINKAEDLINSSGGDWGYVTIPIQAGDKNLAKWQKFMDECGELHVIPILRLATEGDYFNTIVWRKPTKEDVLDFANFLNSLEWPVENRYVVIFNEVNRDDEWEGELSPSDYADLLRYSVSAFKSLNQNFFIISSGLDNAAPNGSDYMNEYDYMRAMNEAVPGVFSLIDGLGSHSYPNPGFKQLPYISTSKNISSFGYEKSLADKLGNKSLPVFITETGWSKDEVSENQIGQYFQYAYKYVWSDKDIVAVTPFLLQAGIGPFAKFSLIDENGNCSKIYDSIAEIPKTKGNPSVNKHYDLSLYIKSEKLPLKTFPQRNQYEALSMNKADAIFDFFRWLLKLYI